MMTTITTNIAWSGAWSRLYVDPSEYENPTISSDEESSSINTHAVSDDGDTVVLSREAQQAVNMDGDHDNGGLDAVSAIYTAAATVINSSSSNDKEKIAAFWAAYTMSSLSNIQTIGPAQYDVSSYGYKFEMLEGKFLDDIKNSSLMHMFLNTPAYNIPDNASDYQKALSDISWNSLDGVAYGVNSISIDLQETTTQAADGSTTTSYAFSYKQRAEAQDGTIQIGYGGLIDPMSAFSGGKTATLTKPFFIPADAGLSFDESKTDKKKKPIILEDSRVQLNQEIVEALFGSSGPKKQDASSATNDGPAKKNNLDSNAKETSPIAILNQSSSEHA